MTSREIDVLLIGGGVMSATLGTLLQQLDPDLKMALVERLDHVAHESTDGWNNAGTGHAGYCELNYTPENANGEVAIERALKINAAFEVSLQLWSSLVQRGVLPQPTQFINPTPHMSFVWGDADVAYLQKRFQKLQAHHLFREMQISTDPRVIREWMPLVIDAREPTQPIAATRVDHGSDVDFGSLTRSMIKSLKRSANFNLLLNHPVEDIERQKDGRWKVTVKESYTGIQREIIAGFVFIGAGGGALPLLQKSEIPEAEGYGGFPVSGQWLVCRKPEIVAQHYAKVYGKAPVGAPPMSVPHLDTRVINGERALLFGPFAGFTTKFLKKGSKLDLLKSVSTDNLKPMMSVGIDNMDLTRYLISESMQKHSDRVASLRNFFPEAREEDWTLAMAGQRVQIIKRSEKGGKLEFGTEIVASADGSIAALLGASPGASTAVQAMLEVLERCLPEKVATAAWQDGLKALIPSYGESLVDDAALAERIRPRVLKELGLQG